MPQMSLQGFSSKAADLSRMDTHIVTAIDDPHILAGVVVFDRSRDHIGKISRADDRTDETVHLVVSADFACRHGPLRSSWPSQHDCSSGSAIALPGSTSTKPLRSTP